MLEPNRLVLTGHCDKSWLHFPTIYEETVAQIEERAKCPWNSIRSARNGSAKKIFHGRSGQYAASSSTQSVNRRDYGCKKKSERCSQIRYYVIQIMVLHLVLCHRASVFLSSLLSFQVMYIAEVMNKHDYVPKMPSQADLELIFDTSYQDVQPYLFKISHATSMPTSPSMGTAVRRLIRDTLTFSQWQSQLQRNLPWTHLPPLPTHEDDTFRCHFLSFPAFP